MRLTADFASGGELVLFKMTFGLSVNKCNVSAVIIDGSLAPSGAALAKVFPTICRGLFALRSPGENSMTL